MKSSVGAVLVFCTIATVVQPRESKAAQSCEAPPPIAEFGYKWDLSLPAHQIEHARWYVAACGDLAKAKYWYEKAASAGLVAAQAELGILEFRLKNYSEALTWLEKAAASNNADAEYTLAYMYTQAAGVAYEPKKGIAYMRRAAEHGHAQAKKLMSDPAFAPK